MSQDNSLVMRPRHQTMNPLAGNYSRAMAPAGLLAKNSWILLFPLLANLFMIGRCDAPGSTYALYGILSLLTLLPLSGRVQMVAIFQIATLFALVLKEYYMSAYQNPYFYGAFSDDYFYDVRWPKKFLLRNTLNYFEIYGAIGYSHNSPLFVYIVTLLYRFGYLLDGYDTMLPRLLNMFFLAQTGGIAYRFLTSTVKVTAVHASKIVLMMCLFPLTIYFHAHVFRDPMVLCLTFFVFHIATSNKNFLLKLICIATSGILLTQLRDIQAAVVMLLMPICLGRTRYRMTELIPVFVIIPVVLYLLTQMGVGTGMLEKSVRYVTSYSATNQERFGALGATVFEMPIEYGLIFRIAFLFMVPAPWIHQLSETGFLGWGTIIQFLLIPFLARAVRNQDIDARPKIFFLAMMFGVAFSTATLRHFLYFVPFAFLLGGMQYAKCAEERDFGWYSKYLVVLSILFSLVLVILRMSV